MFKMYFLYDRTEQIVGNTRAEKLIFKGKLVDSNNENGFVLQRDSFVTGSFSNLLSVAVCRVQKSIFNRVEERGDFDVKVLENKHPHIVKYYGCGEDENFTYKIKELCECSIYDILEKHANKTVYFDDILNSLSNNDVLKQSLSGLSFIHGLWLYHGNIHPDNFLISKTDQNQFVIKLTDFKQEPIDNSNLTGTEVKEGWVSPDFYYQVNDQKTDAFMFGCFIFYLFSGNHPFGRDVADQRYGVKNKEHGVYKKSWIPLTLDNLCVSFKKKISQPELDEANILIKELVVFSRKDRKKINEISLM